MGVIRHIFLWVGISVPQIGRIDRVTPFVYSWMEVVLEVANTLRKIFKDDLCVINICACFEIQLLPINLHKSINGMLFKHHSRDIIAYNKALNPEAQREAIWHEFYHFLFGKESFPNIVFGEDDIFARTFALQLLFYENFTTGSSCIVQGCLCRKVTAAPLHGRMVSLHHYKSFIRAVALARNINIQKPITI